MTTIYLVRHARSMGNKQAFYCGSTDVGLSEEGYDQINYLAERCAGMHFDKIYSSPLIRAVETAKAVNRAHKQDIILRYDIQEINGGDWEGKTTLQLKELYPDHMDKYLHRPWEFEAPNGESIPAVAERAFQAVRRIAEENRGKTVALVSHGEFLRCYICKAMGKSLHELPALGYSPNTGISRVDYDDDLNPHVVFVGDGSHLPVQIPSELEKYLTQDAKEKKE
ncbi:MAG: histidine phosphatase family protein [Ruminococcaceae bacterium]|nr:histidine phosphatase family protein [Oscillospiraceae bacterium]